MSKEEEKPITTVEIEQKNGLIHIDFYQNTGVFGTDEMIDGYVLTPERLLAILQDRDDYSEEEL